MLRRALAALSLLALVSLACASARSEVGSAPPPGADPDAESLEVTATAYNSVPGQTWGDPALTAWGDRLEPGMRALAVSRDLIALGLDHGAEVRIEGMPGTWRVLDKLHRRWTRRIDLYMGEDVQAAREFGKRQVRIYWVRDAAAHGGP